MSSESSLSSSSAIPEAKDSMRYHLLFVPESGKPLVATCTTVEEVVEKMRVLNDDQHARGELFLFYGLQLAISVSRSVKFGFSCADAEFTVGGKEDTSPVLRVPLPLVGKKYG